MVSGSKGAAMFDPDTTVVLRAVLAELCEQVPVLESSTRARVASRILEVARSGEWSVDDLRKAGHDALHNAPTMWR
jgi:hypothetical protein